MVTGSLSSHPCLKVAICSSFDAGELPPSQPSVGSYCPPDNYMYCCFIKKTVNLKEGGSTFRWCLLHYWFSGLYWVFFTKKNWQDLFHHAICNPSGLACEEFIFKDNDISRTVGMNFTKLVHVSNTSMFKELRDLLSVINVWITLHDFKGSSRNALIRARELALLFFGFSSSFFHTLLPSVSFQSPEENPRRTLISKPSSCEPIVADQTLFMITH